MKYSDFYSGVMDEAFRLFTLRWGMQHSDFSSGARDEVFQLLIWGEGWSIPTFNLGGNTDRGPLQKGLENNQKSNFVFMKGNMCTWREEVKVVE